MNQSALFNLCDDNKSFLKILEKEKIKHSGNKLQFEDNEYIYTLKTNLIKNKEERYFHLEIKCESEEKLENYIKYLKELRNYKCIDNLIINQNFFNEINKNSIHGRVNRINLSIVNTNKEIE